MTEEQLNNSKKNEELSAALNTAADIVHKTEKESEIKKQSREKGTEPERSIAIDEMKAKMAENTERAAALARERSIELEYDGEYRQRLSKRINRREKEEKLQREALLKKEKEELERSRELEIKAYLEKEAEETRLRAERAKGLIASLGEAYENKDTAAEPQPSAPETEIPQEEEIPTAADISHNTEEQAVTEESESASRETENEKILLNINATGMPFVKSEPSSDVFGEPILLTIGHSGNVYTDRQNSDFYTAPASVSAEDRVIRPVALAAPPAFVPVPVADGTSRYGEDFVREELADSVASRPEREDIEEYDKRLSESLDRSAERDAIRRDSKISLEAELFAEYERRFGENSVDTVQAEYPDPYPSDVNADVGNLSFGQDEEYRKYDSHIRDERAIIGYEKSRAKSSYDIEDTEQYSEIDERYHSLHGYKSEECNSFHKAELSKKINRYHKEEAALNTKMKRLASKQKNVSREENILIIVEKIAVAKELTELTVDLLVFCVYADVRFKIAKYKRLLEEKVSDYNALCDEYEAVTGRPLARLSAAMAQDVVEGKICEPIPNVYYSGDASFGAYDEKISTGKFVEREREARLSEEAMLVDEAIERSLAGDYRRELTRAENKLAEKQRASEMSRIRYASERALLVNALREEYRLSKVESERDILLNSFDINEKNKAREIRALDKKLSRIKSESRRSAKIEKESSARYYMLYAMGVREEKIKKGARGERLDSMRTRLDILLSERERNAETLIALYGGADKKLREAKINRKARAVRKKYAKMMYRQQRDIADRVAAMKAPLDLKEKVYELLNKKTLAVTTIEESTYKLKKLKPTGRARRELTAAIKRSKASLRRLNGDIKYLMKKIRKHHEKYIDDRNWGVMLAVCALVLVLSFTAYYLYGDAIISFVNKWLLGG